MTNHLKITAFALPVMAAAMLGFTSTASATPITFVGNPTATFLPSVPSVVSFTGTPINVTTDGSGNSGPFSIGVINVSDWTKLGYWTTRDAMTLNLNFTNPLTGSSDLVVPFAAGLNGYYANNFGQIREYLEIYFDSTSPQLVTYSNSSGSGSFDIALTGPSVWENVLGDGGKYHTYYNAGNTISAQITNARFTPNAPPPPAPTPEPSSLILMGTGILGLAGLVSRKALTRAI